MASIPKTYKDFFNIPKAEVERYYKILLSIDLCLNEKVSLAKAAELCEMNVYEFIEELRSRKIKRITAYDKVEDLEAEKDIIEKYSS
jgi:predicted HTH domain antitoxin